MLVLAVRLDIHPDVLPSFRQHILKSKANTLAREPGCKRYDVSFATDDSVCFAYEVFEDRSAFEEHLKTDHFKAFDQATQGMIADKRVEEYELAETDSV